MRKKVSVIIVTFNSIRYLPQVFRALFSQTVASEMEVIVVDNNSDEETKTFLKKQQVKTIFNGDNAGFAKANNQGIAHAEGEYVLCLNHDVILEPDYIEKTIEFMKERRDVGATSGFIKKWDFAYSSFTSTVDTLGFSIFKNHKVIDAHERSFADGKTVEVFGVSAAVATYSRAAIEKLIEISGHFFDDSYGSYKEDVDVAYRLRHAGFRSYVLKNAIAYHDRWETGSGNKSFKTQREARKTKPAFINQMSYANHLITLYKNEFVVNLFKYAPQIILFEFKKLAFIILFEPKTIVGLFTFIKTITLTLKKRRDIFKTTKISSADIVEWLE